MKKQLYVTLVIAFGFPLITTLVAVSQAAQPQNPKRLYSASRISSGWNNREFDSKHR